MLTVEGIQPNNKVVKFMNTLETKQSSINMINMIDSETVISTMEKIATFQATLQKVLKPDYDYGVIPGTQKPTLFKPGGEKICMMFGLHPEYDFLDTKEDYVKGFFAYNIKCTLYKGKQAVAQGVGSCNSMERRYRYINSDSIPPNIDPKKVQSFIDSYGRTKYKIQNPNIYDLTNTILKMAKKRAFIDAVLQVASLSEIFTQDLEDIKEYLPISQKETDIKITLDEAANIKVNFGKYKGKTLKNIFTVDRQYFDWICKNSNDTIIKTACSVLLKSVNSKTQISATNQSTL